MINIIAILITLLASGVARTEALQNNAMSSIKGEVYAYRLGLPLSDVEIQITSESGTKQKTTSARNGSYALPNILPGTYSITAFSKGFIAFNKENITIQQGETLWLDIQLKVGSLDGKEQAFDEIEGTVKLTDQTFLSEATVIVVSALDQEIVARLHTDSKGQYRTKIQGNQFILFAYKAGFETSVAKLVFDQPWPRKPATIDFVLLPLKLKN